MALGFTWSFPVISTKSFIGTRERACFRLKSRFPQYIWNAASIKGTAFTLPEVKTLIDGTTEGGRRISDEQEILNHKESLGKLLSLVSIGNFSFEKKTICDLHSIVAREEALEWGAFRNGPVSIAGTSHRPPEASLLNNIYSDGISTINSLNNPLEQAMVFYLFGALNQFFYDGNKRVSTLMMNGHLMMNGIEAICIPQRERLAYNQKMIRFYDSKNGTEMMQFFVSVLTMNSINLA